MDKRAWRQWLGKLWLMRNDPEALDFWRGMPRTTDFIEAVAVNLHDFGPDEAAEAYIVRGDC
jgi:hypothetical protein